MTRLSRLGMSLALSACTAAPRLDTSCPETGASPAALFAEMAGRGIPGAPDTLRLRLDGLQIAVGWKNLLSGRQLTLSCAYRQDGGRWRLLRARVDEGTHTLQVSGRAEPPALIYRDAGGRLLEVVAVEPSASGGRTP